MNKKYTIPFENDTSTIYLSPNFIVWNQAWQTFPFRAIIKKVKRKRIQSDIAAGWSVCNW